ncbi:flagellar hook-associated protein FlgL [Halodesulfovibrio marinisediminis]|uniref:Flagellar hook-associated protein 3 FlgL n=1 Tax=Halodesulfovibrio marinisediminis DSM 17456 TaxID=1121457 RepID=A0A1N6DS46_9BACT|nr:flagellar hook-associated protein FlgL [Halodesulfovibrio marinisediminis]SIN73615.1 flagellar hook-associated protein 3 FlgL [Halodesulfovibrio marinisediminis DSM 17456]
MRIARSMLYTQSINGMNGSMNTILRLSEQASSQKRINRPSDDPSGAAMVLDLQEHINSLAQYDENINSAKGWLDTANEQLGTISKTIIRMQELANQGATGTLTDKQRGLIAKELRELQVQLIGLTNGDYAGNSLFAGAAIDSPAYEVGLGATVENAKPTLVHSVKGDAKKTIAIKFPVPTATTNVGDVAIPFKYSEDGGKTWKDATIPAGVTDTLSVRLGGVEVNFKKGEQIKQDTTMRIRPAAIYKGSIDGEAKASYYGVNPSLDPVARGEFKTPIAIRIENDPSVSIPGTTPVPTPPAPAVGDIEYSYSLDNGASWIRATASADKFLNIPGGQLDLGGTGTLTKGEQFVVKPIDSAIRIEISAGNSVQVNSVGSNFFGGLYADKMTGATGPANGLSPEKNIFEVVGNLIASLEMDDQDGVKKCLGNLKLANEHITTETGVLGGRQNRLSFALDAHGKSKISTQSRISAIQDVDVAKISTESERAQYIYKSVLSTSAKVMNLSLLDYLR